MTNFQTDKNISMIFLYMLGIPFVYEPIIIWSIWTTHFRVPLPPTYPPVMLGQLMYCIQFYVTFLIFEVQQKLNQIWNQRQKLHKIGYK